MIVESSYRLAFISSCTCLSSC